MDATSKPFTSPGPVVSAMVDNLASARSTENTGSFHQFSKFPDEIKICVLQQAFKHDGPITIYGQQCDVARCQEESWRYPSGVRNALIWPCLKYGSLTSSYECDFWLAKLNQSQRFHFPDAFINPDDYHIQEFGFWTHYTCHFLRDPAFECAGLLRVSKMMHHEGSKILYGQNSFILPLGLLLLKSWVDTIGFQNARHIRHLQLGVPFPGDGPLEEGPALWQQDNLGFILGTSEADIRRSPPGLALRYVRDKRLHLSFPVFENYFSKVNGSRLRDITLVALFDDVYHWHSLYMRLQDTISDCQPGVESPLAEVFAQLSDRSKFESIDVIFVIKFLNGAERRRFEDEKGLKTMVRARMDMLGWRLELSEEYLENV